MMGAERKSALITEKEKRMTSYHEAGHALTAVYTDGAMPLHKVTCMPRGMALGIVRLSINAAADNQTNEGNFAAQRHISETRKIKFPEA